MKKTIILFLFLFISISFSQNQKEVLTIKSNYLKKEVTYLTVKPNDYNAAKKYPLVYLLHGWSGDYKQWDADADLQKYADEYQFIFVCPDALYDSWYINSKELKYEDFFFKEFKQVIHSKFNIDSSLIFISGLSMGGFGSIYYFTNYPEYFRSAGSTSGILDLEKRIQKWGIIKRFDDSNYVKIISPVNTIAKLKQINKPFLIDCGFEDRAYELNELFFNRCFVEKVPVTFIAGPGQHDHPYWKKSIKHHIIFFNEIVQKN